MLIIGPVLSVLTLAVPPDRASADHCLENATFGSLNFRHIFQRGNSGVAGTENKIQFRNRHLGTCDGASHVTENGNLTWSTAHIRIGGATNDVVEVGWFTYYDSNGAKQHRAFTEYIDNNVQIAEGIHNPSPSTCLEVTKSDVWRVKWLQYSTWGLYVNCIDGVGYRHLTSYGNTDDTTGIGMGEVGKLNESEIHSVDLQRDLRRMSTGGSWSSWSLNYCYSDDMADWQPYSRGSDAYDVDWGSGNC